MVLSQQFLYLSLKSSLNDDVILVFRILPGKSRAPLYLAFEFLKWVRIQSGFLWKPVLFILLLWAASIFFFSELPHFGTYLFWPQSTEGKKHISQLCCNGLEMRLRTRIPWLLLMNCNLQQVIQFLLSFFGYKLGEHAVVIPDTDT